MWFRRRRNRVVVRPFDESELPHRDPISLDDAVAEGLMLAEYASRMAVKNAIIVGAVNDETRFDDGTYVSAAREAIDALIAETDASALRIEKQVALAAELDGKADHVHDYHRADVDNLVRRQEQDEALAARLHERRDDDAYLNSLVEHARDDAWREIADAIDQELARVQATETIDPDYAAQRESRLHDFVSEDLALLLSGVEFPP